MIITPEELKAAKEVAKQISYKWKAIETEDLNAQLNEWLVKKAWTGKLQQWRENGTHGRNSLYFSMKSYANKYCLKQQEKQTLQEIKPFDNNGNIIKYQYTKQQIKQALPYLWDYDKIISNNQSELTDLYIQLKQAYNQLNYSQQIIIEYKYREGKTYNEIGEILNKTENATRMYISRLITKLNKLIG